MRKLFVSVLLGLFVFVVPASGWTMLFLDEVVKNLEADLEDGSFLGLGVILIESPYKGVDSSVYPVPVLIFETKQFFADNTAFGYYFNDKSNPLRLAVIGSWRVQGYAADDSSDLDGMQDRDRAFDGGLRLSWKNKVIDMALDGVTDLSGTHEGQEVCLIAFKEFFDGFLKSRVGIKWQSRNLVDYYYGVEPDEARAGRAEYDADSGLEYIAGIRIGLPLGEKWAAFGDVECTFFPDEVKDSPIVDKDALMRYALGAVYRF